MNLKYHEVLSQKKLNHGDQDVIKHFIKKKNLKINNTIVTDPSKKVSVGEKIILDIPDPEKVSLKPYDFKLNIIYEDDFLLVIDKPAGISVHPGPGNYDNTIVNALMKYNNGKLSNIGDELRPGIVHRIDKDTSGLIVVAKDNLTHESLSRQFADHSIDQIFQIL